MSGATKDGIPEVLLERKYPIYYWLWAYVLRYN